MNNAIFVLLISINILVKCGNEKNDASSLIWWDGVFAESPICHCSKKATKKNVSCCHTESVSKFNEKYVYGELTKIVQSEHFKYFKVDLNKVCKFWKKEDVCAIKNCAVDSCTVNELPLFLTNKTIADQKFGCAVGEMEKLHVIKTDSHSDHSHNSNESCTNNEFCDDVDTDSKTAQYVDLVLNPERFTGYSGKTANQIWMSIYKENCFFDKSETCSEYTIFQRLVSGLHASVNLHLVSFYPLTENNNNNNNKKNLVIDENTEWGFNEELFIQRFAPYFTKNKGGEWLRNMHLLYAFLMRAIQKSEHIISSVNLNSGVKEDKNVKETLKKLFKNLNKSPAVLNESALFSEHDESKRIELREEIREKFINITRIMDCVGCDKCRMWGKLQTQGIGTAMKILFTTDSVLTIRRNELVALLNAAYRYSSSLHSLHERIQRLYNENDGKKDEL